MENFGKWKTFPMLHSQPCNNDYVCDLFIMIDDINIAN